MKRCPNCAAELDDRIAFCPYDGTPMDAGLGGGDLVGVTLDERFHLDRRVARDAVDNLFRATDTRNGAPVAVRMLDAQLPPGSPEVAAMLADAERAARSPHPNLLPLLERGEYLRRVYLVEPWVPGLSLAARLERGTLPVVTALDVALNLAEMLVALHDHDLLHLALKPSHVFLVRDPLGLERAVATGVGRHRLLGLENVGPERTGRCLASPSYLAPELVEGRAPTPQTDLYLLGLLLHEMLTGRPAVSGEGFEATAARHLESPPPPPSSRRSEVSPAVDGLVRRCLQRTPLKRPVSARDVAAALAELKRRGGGPSARPLPVNATPGPVKSPEQDDLAEVWTGEAGNDESHELKAWFEEHHGRQTGPLPDVLKPLERRSGPLPVVRPRDRTLPPPVPEMPELEPELLHEEVEPERADDTGLSDWLTEVEPLDEPARERASQGPPALPPEVIAPEVAEPDPSAEEAAEADGEKHRASVAEAAPEDPTGTGASATRENTVSDRGDGSGSDNEVEESTAAAAAPEDDGSDDEADESTVAVASAVDGGSDDEADESTAAEASASDDEADESTAAADGGSDDEADESTVAEATAADGGSDDEADESTAAEASAADGGSDDEADESTAAADGGSDDEAVESTAAKTSANDRRGRPDGVREAFAGGAEAPEVGSAEGAAPEEDGAADEGVAAPQPPAEVTGDAEATVDAAREAAPAMTLPRFPSLTPVKGSATKPKLRIPKGPGEHPSPIPKIPGKASELSWTSPGRFPSATSLRRGGVAPARPAVDGRPEPSTVDAGSTTGRADSRTNSEANRAAPVAAAQARRTDAAEPRSEDRRAVSELAEPRPGDDDPVEAGPGPALATGTGTETIPGTPGTAVQERPAPSGAPGAREVASGEDAGSEASDSETAVGADDEGREIASGEDAESDGEHGEASRTVGDEGRDVATGDDAESDGEHGEASRTVDDEGRDVATGEGAESEPSDRVTAAGAEDGRREVATGADAESDASDSVTAAAAAEGRDLASVGEGAESTANHGVTAVADDEGHQVPSSHAKEPGADGRASMPAAATDNGGLDVASSHANEPAAEGRAPAPAGIFVTDADEPASPVVTVSRTKPPAGAPPERLGGDLGEADAPPLRRARPDAASGRGAEAAASAAARSERVELPEPEPETDFQDVLAPSRPRIPVAVWVVGAALLLLVGWWASRGGPEPTSTEPDAAVAAVVATPPEVPPPPIDAGAPPVDAAPDPRLALFERARAAVEAERWEGGDDALVETLAQLRALGPDDADTTALVDEASARLVKSGDAARAGGQRDAARALYTTAGRIKPGLATATAGLAALDRARPRARRRRSKRPTTPVVAPLPPDRSKDPKALVASAQAHLKAARWAKAQAAFAKAVKVAPRAHAAHAGLGEAAFQSRDFQAAVRHGRRAVEIAPWKASYRVDLGMALFKLGRYQEARDVWRKALRHSPSNKRAHRYLKLVEKKLKQ